MAAFPATQRIGRFVAETTFDSLPAAAVDTTRIAFLDLLGVALAGSSDSAASLVARLVRDEAAAERATVIGHGFRSSAQQAAFANGVAGHALDYDHSFNSGGQPTSPLIPAVLAVAEEYGATGRELIEACAIGFEVTTKISQSLYAVDQYAWHAPGNMGVLGATAGCAKLMSLTSIQTQHALGMAVSMAGGVEANFGTMTKPLHVGQAARNAVVAVKLAASGYTANVESLETSNGYYDAYYGVKLDVESPLDELGQVWELVESGLRIKPYPCGGLAHTAIDAALLIRAAHVDAGGTGFDASTVESVLVEVTDRVLGRIVFGMPATELQAKFSMPYLISRALIDGRVGLSAFTDLAIRDESILNLAAKVTMELGSDLRSTKAGRQARVIIQMTKGPLYSQQVNAAKGGTVSPMSSEELRIKFKECATRVISPESADLLAEAISTLDTAPDLRLLTSLLMGDPA